MRPLERHCRTSTRAWLSSETFGPHPNHLPQAGEGAVVFSRISERFDEQRLLTHAQTVTRLERALIGDANERAEPA